MRANLLLIVLLAALCLKVDAYPTYRAKIPNGYNVPNPCNLSTIWPGVGHKNVYGSGERNLFGLDFAANNHVWDQTLCEKDSDGDGRKNGQELGDPNCTWTAGRTPMFTTNLSHPGVCEPVDSPLCAVSNSWMMNCIPRKLDCPAKDAPGVRDYALRFPVTPIPAKETTYICYIFALPNDSISDIIAIEPVIDNKLILHHMMLFASNDEPKDHRPGESFECGMESTAGCSSSIGIWGVGIAGQCLNSQLGFRIGPGEFRYAILQLHWNNPENKTNQTDSSGMRIYLTDQLRPNRGKVAIMGQISLEIPPGKPEVTFTGRCSALCTLKMFQSIFLTSGILHMHTLGKSGEIRLIRSGGKVEIIYNVTQYDYGTPALYEFGTPIELKPGDAIEVKCVYDSTHRTSTTYYGEATSDEMCFAFLAYYPLIDDLGFCGQLKIVDLCPKKYKYEPVGICEIGTLRDLLQLHP